MNHIILNLKNKMTNVNYGIYLNEDEIYDIIDQLRYNGILKEYTDTNNITYNNITNNLQYIFEQELSANNLLKGLLEVSYINKKIYIGIDVLERGTNNISFSKLGIISSYDDILEEIITYVNTDCDIQLRVIN